MSDIPMFSARGNTDSEKISEIASYLSGLSSSIDRELLSIDFSNLNSDLADRINKSVTEHQDLSGFASKNYTKNNFYTKSTVNGIKANLKSDISAVDTRVDEVNGKFSNYYTAKKVDELISGIQDDINDIWEAIRSLQNAT